MNTPSLERRRPTAVMVLAILHLVGGGLHLLILLCSGAANLSGGLQGGQANVAEAYFEQAIPHFRLIQWTSVGLDLLLDVFLIAAGIGLLNMQNWARVLSLIYACLSIPFRIAYTLYSLLVLLPATADFFKQMAPNPAMPPGAVGLIQGIGSAVTLISLLFLIYPIVVLIILTRPAIVAAFHGEAPPSTFPQDELDAPRVSPERPEGIQPPQDRIT